MRIATQEDDELALLKHTITHGWPSTIREVPSEIQPYWTFREELTVEDGLILKGTWIVVPHKKHQATLQLMHEGHLDLGKCKLRAKDIVYWPGLNDLLEKLVLNCKLCLKYSHSKCNQKPSTSLGQEIPVHPWSKLATDIFLFEGVSYFLIVDYRSRFTVVCKLSSMTGLHVANQCKLVFSVCGWHTLISDNGPCYTSQALTSAMQKFSVNHITSSLQYLESNGLAEKYVQIVKCLHNKAKEKGKDLYKCLMIYHNNPLTGSLQSPMQNLQGRSARSDLPMSNAAREQLGIWPEGTLASMKCYLHMTYIWVKVLCTRIV